MFVTPSPGPGAARDDAPPAPLATSRAKAAWWSPRKLAWCGGAFIAAMALQAGWDIWQGYVASVAATSRDVSRQSRLIAEQTARGIQAVDVVLKHLAEHIKRGTLSLNEPDALHRYLREEAAGLVQTDGLVAFGADGTLRAVSLVAPDQLVQIHVAAEAPFVALRDQRGPDIIIDNVRISPGTQRHVFPIGRRLEDRAGRFIGVIGAPGRVEYFENFYRDTYADPSTRISLVHRNGWLLARYPPAPAALGRRLDVVERLLPPSGKATSAEARLPSPVDGIDHFVALQQVPDYPLIVAVSRDADAALAPWRAQATATALRTLALGALAAALLWTALRQLARTQTARRSLEVSEERYALAMTGSNEGHWLWDIGARQVYVSAKLAELFSLPGGAQVLPDDTYFAAIPLHADDRERVHHSRNEHVAGRTPRLDHEFRIVDPASGEVRWIHTRAQCFRDASGKPLRMAGATVDATRRKRAEEALRESEARFAAAVAGADSGIWEWDFVRGQVFSSSRGRVMLGLPPSPEVQPLDAWRAEIEAQIHPDDRPRRDAALAEHLAGRSDAYDVDFRVRHAGDAWRWVHIHGRCERDGDGKVLRMAGSGSDITERKQAEIERQRLEEQLRQAQKLEAIGTLAGGIAHDFNNILSAILGYGELAQKAAPAGSAQRRHIDAAISAGQRAKSLVERILAFSRSGTGARVPVHVQSVVDEALDGVAATLPPDVHLQRRLEAGDAGVLGDATQIHQVVLNLCANAVQAMKSGGRVDVTLDVTTLAVPLPVATNTLPPGPYLRLAIADTGTGIDAALLGRIFDPFFTTKEVGVGTGLGLSLVHGIVTDLGGGITVLSQPGAGSCFTVYLPQRVHAPAPRPAAQASVEQGSGQTVLLVDDEEALVRLGEETLAELGYEPVGYTSSAAALEALRADPQRFDLLLSDETMPSLTGSELAAQARALRPELPVVLMSGYVTPALTQRAREFGVREVLTKPLAAAELARALAAALRTARR